MPLQQKRVLVIGLGASGLAACRLLRAQDAQVVAVDNSSTDRVLQGAKSLRLMGIDVQTGSEGLPPGDFDLAVVSPGVPDSNPILAAMRARGVRVISELELGYRHALCPSIAVTGTNGKTTTTELIERLLKSRQVRTVACGNIGLPVSDVAPQTRELDFLTIEVSSFQLEAIQFFRPVIAVLLNITPDHLDRYRSMDDYRAAKARVFLNQQPFDWAIVQSEALAQLQQLKISVPSKLITFSSEDRNADIYLDSRRLLISRIEGWSGPLLDLDRCQLRGPHNAENLMAALAVGRILRIPLDAMVECLSAFAPSAHRCELVDCVDGVDFINDSKATNIDALCKALLTVSKPGLEPNIWLIAGGKDKGFDFHDAGPLLAQRVKQAFLIGETRVKLRAAWSLFTRCQLSESLDQAVAEAARLASPGDVVLLSPACSSFDQFDNYQHRGEAFRQAVLQWKQKLAQDNPGCSSQPINPRHDVRPAA